MSEETTKPDPLDDLSKLISITRASEISGLTPGYIRRLLRQERLVGKKVGRDWFTTEESMQEFLDTDRRRGRPKLD